MKEGNEWIITCSSYTPAPERVLISLCHLALQFFGDVKEVQEKMNKMQENMKKKYSCDGSTTATRLEDLLQDAAVGGIFSWILIINR